MKRRGYKKSVSIFQLQDRHLYADIYSYCIHHGFVWIITQTTSYKPLIIPTPRWHKFYTFFPIQFHTHIQDLLQSEDSSLCPVALPGSVFCLLLGLSKLRLCSVNHRAGYFSNLACDWLSIVWTYSGLYRQTNLSNLLLKTLQSQACPSNSGCARSITWQVTSVTWPVIGWA